ncbi:MAG: TIGR02266 family protein, partial [Proteobacteria bacterium]|nr:TIGR02266 family protein [Pseudomonadota bacterium]
MARDGRRDPRQPISLEIRFKSATLTDFVEKYSRDISRGGIFIKTASPMPSGTLIKLNVKFGDEESLIQGVGRVVWRRLEDSGDDSPAGMGIKFIKLDQTSRENLEKILSGKTEEKGVRGEAPVLVQKETSRPSRKPQPIAPVRPQAAPKGAKRTMIGIGPLGKSALSDKTDATKDTRDSIVKTKAAETEAVSEAPAPAAETEP